MFACHLVRCEGAEEKRNESSTAHITGGSLGLSASVSRNKRGKKKKSKTPTQKKSSRDRRKKDLPYAFTGDCVLFVVTQTSEGIDFQGTGYREPYFSTLPFQVFVLKCFLCSSIFSAQGGHSALPLNTCKLQPCFLCFHMFFYTFSI